MKSGRSVLGGCSHWGRDNGAQHLLLAGRRDPPVKRQGEQGSVGGIDEKGWSQGDAAGRKEEKGKEERRRPERIQAFLPLDDPVPSCSLLRHCFLRELWGPAKPSRFSPAPGSSPSPGARPLAGAQYLLGKNEKCGQLCSGNFSPVFSPLPRRRRGQSRSWEHAQAPHE